MDQENARNGLNRPAASQAPPQEEAPFQAPPAPIEIDFGANIWLPNPLREDYFFIISLPVIPE